MGSTHAGKTHSRNESRGRAAKRSTRARQPKVSPGEQAAKLAAIDKVQAVIEFAMDGTILAANENFLSAMGYRLDEIKDQHHRMFVDPEYGRSSAYRQFWERLKVGEYQAGEYRRIGKGGKEVWIQASFRTSRLSAFR
jgi:methyl-accepting chemotaxis protein